MNLALTLEIPGALMPETDVVRGAGISWTYADLISQSSAAAVWLRSRGASANETVATLQGFSPAFVALTYGALAIGAPLAPLNARVKADELIVLLENARPKLIVADERYADLVTDALARCSVGATCVTTDALLAGLAVIDPPPFEPMAPADGTVSILLHTSGTTGAPKPVPLTHDGMMSALLRTVAPPDGTPRGATVLAVPNHHVAGIVAMFTSIFGGRRIELLDTFSSAAWLALVQASECDHAFVVPTMLQRILADPRFHDTDLSRLAVLAYGAAPMPPRVITEAMARFPHTCRFVGSYGQTETGGTVCVLGPDDHLAARAGDVRALARLASIGRPLDDVELAILGEDERPRDPGRSGEIAIRLPGHDTQTWRRTGDLGHQDHDGYVYLSSRQDDLIIRGGENIDPVEIENVLGELPGVAEVAIAGLPDDEWGQIVAAFIVPSGAPPSVEEVVAHVKRSLASYKAPARVLFVAALPRTATGKLRRRQLVDGRGDDAKRG